VGSGCQWVMRCSSHKGSDEGCHGAASSCDQGQHLHAIAHANDTRAICHLKRSMAGASAHHHSYSRAPEATVALPPCSIMHRCTLQRCAWGCPCEEERCTQMMMHVHALKTILWHLLLTARTPSSMMLLYTVPGLPCGPPGQLLLTQPPRSHTAAPASWHCPEPHASLQCCPRPSRCLAMTTSSSTGVWCWG
jgi:hypothetical protein